MSDLGSHDNDVPYTVLDLWRQDAQAGRYLAPLTVQAESPNVPKPHKELAPATLKATYEYAAVGNQPALTLVWHQGDSKPPGWAEAWGTRSCVFMGEKGMLLGNGKLLPEDRFVDFKDAGREPAALAGALGRVGEPRQGQRPGSRVELPVRVRGRPKRTTSATSPTAPARRSSGTGSRCGRRTRPKRRRTSSVPSTARAGTIFSRPRK